MAHTSPFTLQLRTASPRSSLLRDETLVGDGAVMTAHPMGGAAIASSADRGVVDDRREVFGHPGLYVADGATYAAPPGIPPSVTIAAIAERQAELLATEAGAA